MAATGGGELNAKLKRVLAAACPGEEARYFLPIAIGCSPEQAGEGAAQIRARTKTLTSSPLWDYPDGAFPFAGALSVLLDGAWRAIPSAP
ncbi:ASCH domain-containing protein [Sabulicella rubraurantiaca]|uniref:hypothetical protein n=1 Tax=Sabulicella rubraurantiaca TaxID=2811429 RepID=UPI001A964D82|nr:hypothetical protein [Sabulicella rubraurantiaca]